MKDRIAHGEQLVGALVRIPATDIIEMLGVAGLDFIVIDCEHGPADVDALRQDITAAELHGMGALVRIGHREEALALRALDQGAQGIIGPHVDSSEDASALVKFAHYPPQGNRGFATYSRAGSFGTVPAPEHQRRAADSVLVIAMLESPRAVTNAGAILATPGVDGYLVGPADLRASSTPADPTLADSLAAIEVEATHAQALRCELVSGPQEAQKALAEGAELVVYNLTQVLMSTFATLRGPVTQRPDNGRRSI